VVLHAFVPGYDRFRVSSRWFSVLPAFSLALAAAGVEALLADSRRAHRAIYAAAAVAAAAILAYGGFVLADPSSPKRFFAEALAASLVPVGALVAAARLVPGRREVAFALISSAVVFEILLHTVTWYPSVRKSEAYPPLSFAQAIRARGGRMVRVAPAYTQLGPFPPDLPMPYHLADAEGQAVLFPSRYDRFLRLVDNYGMYALATNTAPPLTRPQMLTSPLMRALDVRTAVVDPSVRMPRRFHRVASVGIDAYAVRSLGPAILVPHARPTTTANMWRSIADPKWNPASFAAVVGLPRAVDGEPGKVTLLRKSFDRENWHVVAPRGGLLRISGNYNPGWSARIDGRPTRIFLADGIFRSVVVPEGTHNVQFAYRNQAEGLGRKLAMAALGAIVLLLLPLRSTFRPRRKEVVQA
jgi:hypothetical protein